jgi:hypothetical protein
MPGEVLEALGAAYEQWDGKGWPGELKGDQVPYMARIAQLAEFSEVAYRVGGVLAVQELARRRAGKQFDPALAATMASDAEPILAGLDTVSTWDEVIEAEPALAVVLSGERFDLALAAIANFVDLKSPYTLGHAQAVADLAASAGLGSQTPSGTSPDYSAPANGKESACILISLKGCFSSPSLSRLLARSPSSSANVSTDPAIRAGFQAQPFRDRRGFWAPLTRTRRCASRAHTATPAAPMTPLASCARMSGQGGTTPPPWRPFSVLPDIESLGDAKARPASHSGKLRSCASLPAAYPTR